MDTSKANNSDSTQIDNPTYEKVFGEELQRRIVAMMIYDHEALTEVKDIIRPENFGNPVLSDLAKIILDYRKEYGHGIDIDELTQELNAFLENPPRPLPFEVYRDQYIEILDGGAKQLDKGFQYVLDQVLEWSKYQAFRQAILTSIDLLRYKKDYAGIMELFQNAMAIGQVEADRLEIPSDLNYKERPIKWMWPKVIPFGMATIISGDSSVGKTFIGVDIAARLSTGRPFPGCDEESAVSGETIYMVSELPIEEAFLPRLIAAGVKRGTVYPFKGEYEIKGKLLFFDISRNMPMIERFIEKHPNVRCLIIDPAVSFVSEGAKMNEMVAARHIMDHLIRFAAKTGLAVVIILHLNKDQTQKLIHRTAGSHQILAAVPMGWVVGFDRKDPERRASDKRRLMMPSKSNIGPMDYSYAWRVVNANHYNEEDELLEVGRAEWEESPIFVDDPEAEISPGAAQERKQSKLDQAKEFILERLRSNEPILSTELKGLARDEGFSETTYARAFAELKKAKQIDSKPAGSSDVWWVSMIKR